MEPVNRLRGSEERLPESAASPACDDLGEDFGAVRGAGERLLLADDNADMREYIRQLLVTRGYHVEAVADGKAALAAAQKRRPDLVLSDVMMPHLDGFGLLAQLRADPELRELPIILLSAQEASIEGLEAGADDYVSKPFSVRELLACVRLNLQLPQMRKKASGSPALPTSNEVRTSTNLVGSCRDSCDGNPEQQRRELLVNEPNHRVRNTLSTVQSLATHLYRSMWRFWMSI